MTEALVVHAITRQDWLATADEVRPASLAEEGFIHFSAPSQIARVANARLRDLDDLVLLVVPVERLPQPLVWEDSYGAGEEFPHLYAPLPVGAVDRVIDFSPGPDGDYQPPDL